MPTIPTLLDQLSALPTTDRLSNPYLPPADPLATIRRENLTRYLSDIQARTPRLMLLFEAPGYNGCALSGIPVTSERILLTGIEKWGLFGPDSGYRPTSENPKGVAEMTATILWQALVDHVDQPPLVWNSLPLHPHKPGQMRSNRTPTQAELRMGMPFVEAVLDLFGCSLVMGVGRKAQWMLGELGIKHVPLRHPSQGGKRDFIEGLTRALT